MKRLTTFVLTAAQIGWEIMCDIYARAKKTTEQRNLILTVDELWERRHTLSLLAQDRHLFDDECTLNVSWQSDKTWNWIEKRNLAVEAARTVYSRNKLTIRLWLNPGQ